MSTCPPEELLACLGSDALEGEGYAGLEDHIETCAACQALLQRLVDEGQGLAGSAAVRMPEPETFPSIPDLAIERELGRGSMGVVYLAGQENLQRLVAVKILRVGPDTGSRERGRLQREARAASRAPHPNAVQVFQVGESAGCLYLVFEYVSGGTLKERLREPLPPHHAARLLEEIARAVGHFHRAGVLHLDLKPSNILLDGDNDAGWEQVTPKVADFGISRLKNEPGATTGSRHGPLGTPDYMAPEQAAGDRTSLGPACDIYALGAILYHALTGRPPFQAASVVETLDQVRGLEPLPLRGLNPCVPRDLDTICLKCLQKDPRRRYESAEALADDLHRWREGRPITARPASTFEHVWRWCRRRPAIAALTAAQILTLVASFVGLVVLLKHADAERAQAISARRLAEENEKAAVAVIKQLNLLATTAASDSPSLLGERTIESTGILRGRIGKLKSQPGFDRNLLGGLGVLDRLIAEKFKARGRQTEARALLAESVALLEENRRFAPADPFLLQQHIGSLIGLATIGPLEDQADQAIECLEKAEALLAALAAKPARIAFLTCLSDVRHDLANQLAARGDHNRFRRLLGTDVRMFNSLDAVELKEPKLAMRKVRTLESIGELAQARELLRSTLEGDVVDSDLRNQLEQILAGLTARLVHQIELSEEFSSSAPGDTCPGAWADALLAKVHARCKIIGIETAVAPEVVWVSAPSAFSIASEQRRQGKLADACRTGERVRALADRLVTLYPDQPASYMVLSDAFVHQAKAAWKVDDNEAAHHLERQALDAAHRAFDLDPRSEDARRLVEDREQRAVKQRRK